MPLLCRCFPFRVFLCLFVAMIFLSAAADHRRDLAVGIAGHAFDHLGNIGDQADAAAASGANIIYVTGLGSCGYVGLPPQEDFTRQKNATASYIAKAKRNGIRLAIGYVCATSIVKLKDF